MFILSLDQGTTSSRAVIFDKKGQIVSIAQEEYPQIYPQPGWVEHDAEKIWDTQLRMAHRAIADARIDHSSIKGIGITNQRETTVVWHRRTGKPIFHAIVWQDRRTAPLCDALRTAGLEDTIERKTGLRLDPYFSGTKLKWLLDHVPNARKQAENGELAFGTIDSWLMWNLTGGQQHCIEISNASRTLLYNIHELRWDVELLRKLDIPDAILPKIVSSSEIYALTANNIFPTQIPIAGIAGDQQAALFGQRCTKPGMVKSSYGTGNFMLLNTGEKAVRSNNKLLTTIAWKIDDKVEYALEGSVFVCGAVLQWLRDELKLIKTAKESAAIAASIPNNEGVYFVPAFTGLGAPHWDPYARGLLSGLTRGTTSAHIVRAALEGIAYQAADLLDAMSADFKTISEIRVDGAASANPFLMQFQADIMGIEILRASVLESTALGAAYLAGLATGVYKDQTQLDSLWEAESTFIPSMDQNEVLKLKDGWNRAVNRAKTL